MSKMTDQQKKETMVKLCIGMHKTAEAILESHQFEDNRDEAFLFVSAAIEFCTGVICGIAFSSYIQDEKEFIDACSEAITNNLNDTFARKDKINEMHDKVIQAKLLMEAAASVVH